MRKLERGWRVSRGVLLAVLATCTGCAARDTSAERIRSPEMDATAGDAGAADTAPDDVPAGDDAGSEAEAPDAQQQTHSGCEMRIGAQAVMLQPASWVRTADPFPEQLSILCGNLEQTALAFGVSITPEEPAEGTFRCGDGNLRVVQTEVAGADVRSWEANIDLGACTLVLAPKGERLEGTFELTLESEAHGPLAIREGSFLAEPQ